jgi:hypothetical protein
MQQTESKKPTRTLTDVAGAPFIFHLKDGTPLGMDDWTLASESWAKSTFGSMEAFNNTIFRQIMKEGATEADMDAAVEASIQVAARQLDEDSSRQVEERRKEGQTTEEFLAAHLRYNDFKALCHAIIKMIEASFPEGWEEDMKKKVNAQRTVIPPTKKNQKR